jgi:hypothetical protein
MVLKPASNNSKLKENKERIATFSIPEYKDQLTGEIICIDALHCIGPCFFAHGPTSWARNQAIYSTNYELTKSDRFSQLMINEIDALAPTQRPEWVRVHVGGDFYHIDYMHKWIEIAAACPDIMFYGYTKSIPMLHSVWNDAPANWDFAQSYGGRHDALIDTSRRYAKVYAHASYIPKGHVNATHNDLLGFQDNHRIALEYKGSLDRASQEFVHGLDLLLDKKGRLAS